MKRFLLSLVTLTILTCLGTPAQATAKFLVLCTTACTWDNTNDAIWSLSSGGINNTTHPVAGDAVTLDASSCVGGVTCTITVNANIAATSVTMGTCTASTTGCVLDFSANNNSPIFGSFSATGTGTRTLNCGSGTWTLTATSGTVWDNATVTNETLSCAGGTIDLNATGSAARTFSAGAKTYNNITVTNSISDRFAVIISGSATYANVTFTNVRLGQFGGGFTCTITGALTFNGTSTSQAIFSGSGGGIATLTLSGANTLNWLAVQGITKAGAGSLTVNNGFDTGGNTSVTVNPPIAGGGGIIGG